MRIHEEDEMATIEEQVEVLMAGTAYGAAETRANMAKDLR